MRGRDQSQQGELIIHAPHFVQGHQAENQSVKEHQDTITKTFLDGINIIGVKAHQVADLVNLVILLRKLAAVVKHPLAQVGSNPHSGAEKQIRHKKRPMTMSTTIQIMGRQMCCSKTSLVKGRVWPFTTTCPRLTPLMTRR